ncbi:DotA/TraY family protein [Desulfuromonas sp. AOP6]|uniref:DotA/TraY family protein n=1 Tax=Desulfuromonas sp. AOP6 TaxID=1566351 RepID=UPI00126BAAE6|nr:DotA/TraY family protein [Desulfuromonas sp. AOP6]BCA79292.1 hypothetical protein AOP6_1079 [Desulfuromonas sp. AOP6]
MAPLVGCIAHMIPEGDGMAGQYGRQGYMLLFGILARPPLMVAGLFCSMVIMAGVGKFIGYCFVVYYESVTAGNVTGIITMIAQIAILGGTVVVFAHKIFGLTTHLPEKVIRWIGQMHDDLGVGADESRVRGIALAAGGKVEGATAEAATSAKKAIGGKKQGGGGAGGGGDEPSQEDVELSTTNNGQDLE